MHLVVFIGLKLQREYLEIVRLLIEAVVSLNKTHRGMSRSLVYFVLILRLLN
jgi:hypothetical protein